MTDEDIHTALLVLIVIVILSVGIQIDTQLNTIIELGQCYEQQRSN